MSLEIGIYGLGRFGSFWGNLLSRYTAVKGYTRSPHRKTPEGVSRVTEEELLRLPVIIICTSISSFEDVIRRIAGAISPGTLVMDTCSVKVYPCRIMKQYLSKETEIIATHPMFGPDSSKNGVSGFPLIFCPIRAREITASRWRGFYEELGLEVKQMTPQEHDLEAAYTQGITHYIGRVLSDLGLKPSEIATLGYRKLLEIMDQTCNDPWQLFLDLQRFNPYTRSMREKLYGSLERIMTQLDTPLDISKGDD